ncbi:MAG: zinc ribbon domain-containing protein [Sulfuricaulis sp.]|uniref:zinc ribbon domain-containing protein n=1 Tax=Sulfuricaulis sp. TaxID=2003553 RepID=UPI003C684FE2
MTARSIFQKVCPECMATVPLDTRECSCGHQLDHDDTDTALSSEEIRLKAEELYENYLGARVDQAAKAVKTARADFARDPSKPAKSDQVDSAIREAQMAESALAAQSARVAEMKKALLPTARPAAPVPVATPARKRATALKVVPARPHQARITRKPIPVLTEVVAAAPAPARQKHEAPKMATTEPVPVRPKHQAIVVVSTTASAHQKHEAPKIATTEPVPVRPKHQAKVVATAPQKLPRPMPTSKKPDIAPPAQSATPNPAFRQAQAAKAEKILRAKNAQPAPVVETVKEEARMVPVAEPKPPQTTPVITAKSAPRLYAPRDKKECPNCTASVTIVAPRCRCGYEFPSSEQLIPALAMSDEERAEFAKLFNFP